MSDAPPDHPAPAAPTLPEWAQIAREIAAPATDFRRADHPRCDPDPREMPPDDNPAAAYVRSLESARSQRVQLQALDAIARWLATGRFEPPPGTAPRPRGAPPAPPGSHPALAVPWWRLRWSHTSRIAAALRAPRRPGGAPRFAPATRERMLAALRQTLRAAWRQQYMTLEHVTTACDLGRVKGVRQPRGRALSRRETARLRAGCAAAPSPAAAARDAAALALLRFAGLRRDELATLRVEKMDMASSEPKIVVRGKGDRDREIPLPTDAVAAIAPWLALRGRQAGPLLLPVRKNGKIVADVDGPMTGNVVYQLLRRAAARTGVAAVAPHDMRRTYISELLDRGADLAVIARLVDHRSVATTQGYDRRGKSAERAAANLLNGDDAADGALSMAKPARETDPERDSDEPEADPVQDPEEAGGPAGGEADPRGAD